LCEECVINKYCKKEGVKKKKWKKLL
jgi:hypothetical protein